MENKKMMVDDFDELSQEKLRQINGGTLVYQYSISPYSFYKDTFTGKLVMKQTISTPDLVFGTMVVG
ncbi:MAG: lactococcin family bacteriocin [Streptococcaceae bacterium]|nr:lactococcin family bacteriocin [Streptococcaceae bacterium]